MWLLKPMHKVYKDDGADEIDHLHLVAMFYS